MWRRRVIVGAAALAWSWAAAAQEPAELVPARLIAPSPPDYPEGAVAERLHGVVTVLVTVGADGAVLDVVYQSGGPEIFVGPAIEAGRRLQFEAATLDGQPVETRIPATFHFEPPELDLEDVEEIVVTAPSAASEDTHAVVTLGPQELARASGQDLGEAVGQVPGVATARGTSDATKPIIRGQYERRLLVLFDGVRHESQKWGLDHATEIDPFAAGEISVIKGAAGVRFGPDAVGGVVLVEPPPLRREPGVSGVAQAVGVSNGARGIGAIRLDAVAPALPELTFRLEGNYGRGAALSAPDYVLGNTGSEAWNAGAAVGWQRDLASVEIAVHHYDFTGGVCYCVTNGTPDDFLGQVHAEAPVGSEDWTTRYEIDRPYQTVTHDIALARSVVGFRGGSLQATYAFQRNRRREYEQARASVTGAQYDFELRTHSLDASVTQEGVSVGDKMRLTGGAGVAATFQENVYSGLPLIPNYRAAQAGVYAFQRLERGEAAVEIGARYDHLSRTAFLTPSAFARSEARGSLSEEDCEVGEDAARCPASYDAATVSLGALWHVVPDALDARIDLSSASRFPNADELYMNGSAPTWPVYAIGDPGLGVETTWGASPTLGARLSWVEAEASGYANLVDQFVYFAPEIGPSGEPAIDVTIQGAFPRYAFRAIDAVFYGVDGGLTLGPALPVRLALQGSLVRAADTATGEALVGIPADRVEATLKAAQDRLGPLNEAYAAISGQYVARQTRVDESADFAPPPDAYFLLGAGIGAKVPVGDRAVTIGVEADNLLDTAYRDYTSLLRYYAHEPGREVRVRLAFDF